jgi:hypothetical protein
MPMIIRLNTIVSRSSTHLFSAGEPVLYARPPTVVAAEDERAINGAAGEQRA